MKLIGIILLSLIGFGETGEMKKYEVTVSLKYCFFLLTRCISFILKVYLSQLESFNQFSFLSVPKAQVQNDTVKEINI